MVRIGDGDLYHFSGSVPVIAGPGCGRSISFPGFNKQLACCMIRSSVPFSYDTSLDCFDERGHFFHALTIISLRLLVIVMRLY